MKARSGEALKFLQEVVFAYEGDECLVWPYSKSSKGYGSVKFSPSENWRTVSRVVCERFYGPPPTAEHHAAHKPRICHNRACCNKRHLRWATAQENQNDRLLDGTRQYGARATGAKLTEQDVLDIRAMRGISQKTIAARFGIDPSTVSNVKRGRYWGWLA